MLVEHGVCKRPEIESRLGLNLRDVERLCGVGEGYLDTKNCLDPVQTRGRSKLITMLDTKHKSSYKNEHEQTAPRQAHSNPRHAVRGIVYAFDQPRCRCVDQHRHEAA